MYLDGSSGVVGNELHALMAVHARACAAAPPDPKRLGAWLATTRLDVPGWPDFELGDFAGALGEAGRAEVGRIVEARAAAAEPDVLGRTPFGIRILRDQAIERLRGAVPENPAVANHAIAVLLDEDRQEQAWQIAISYPGEVLESRWHELIDVRQHGHPAEVIGPLQQLIEQRLAAGGDKHRYSRAITTIRQLRAAHHAAGDDSGLATYLEDLRRRHKRKTSFLAKLDRAKL
jgi:hypothetical protein